MATSEEGLVGVRRAKCCWCLWRPSEGLISQGWPEQQAAAARLSGLGALSVA